MILAERKSTMATESQGRIRRTDPGAQRRAKRLPRISLDPEAEGDGALPFIRYVSDGAATRWKPPINGASDLHPSIRRLTPKSSQGAGPDLARTTDF